ncbi:hypothetical protein Ga0076813_15721, partial [endosymbiont of Ridgeia piscesae]
MSTKISG